MDTQTQSFEWVVQTYSPLVLRAAFLYLQNTADAEDVAQDVFVAYWRTSPVFENEAARKSWLYKTTANRCRDRLKSFWHSRRSEMTEDISYLPEEESELLCCLMKLDTKYRIPLHLHYYEGYSIKEIAGILRLRPSTVGSRLHRGKEKLKLMLGGSINEII